MARAIWNGEVLAESEVFETVEGNVYFPPGALKREHFQDSATHTECGWKGTASYFDVVAGGRSTRTLPGTTPIPSRPRPTSRVISPSGRASRWRNRS